MSSSLGEQSDAGGAVAGKDGLIPGFLKNLTDKKTKDGQTPKRRGPKPDSKPALTRRQELNRQAQRTHRERKELYIKALEDEVLRLKEVYANVCQDKDKLAEENRQLKGILSQNGLSPGSTGALDDLMSDPSLGYTSSNAGSVSYAHASSTAYTSPPPGPGSAPFVGGQQQHTHQHQHALSTGQQQPVQHPRVDYDQAGIDFVLTYENPDDPSKAYMSPPPQ